MKVRKIILFLVTAFVIGGCASNQSVSHNQKDLQLLATQEGLQSLTNKISTKRDSEKLVKTIKNEAWKYVETTSNKSVEDAHVKAMKIINNPKNYSKKELAVWENLTAQPFWKWYSYSFDGGKTYHLIMYIVESDLK